MTDFYREMMSRNWAYLSPEAQEKIRNTKILLAGCGLGSNIAVIALQTGFTKFVIADHDFVAISNLNRQAFDRRHLAMNKALALKSILEEKSEAVEVEAFNIKITPANAKELIRVTKPDVIVNMVDFDETMYVINDIAREQGKPVFFPMNIGWMHGFCIVFTAKSVKLEDMLGGKVIDDEMRFFTNLIQSITNYQLPAYLLQNFDEIIKVREEKNHYPQLGVGAFCVSGVVIDSIVRYVLGLPLSVAPRAMTLVESFRIPRELLAKVKAKGKVKYPS